LALSLAACYPELFKYLPQLYIGGSLGDAGIYIWLVKNNIDHVLTFPSQFFDVGFFYPYGCALAFSDNFLFPSLLVQLLLPLIKNYVYAYNIVLLLAFVANGTASFALARYITKNSKVAVLAGVAFMYSPFLFSHLGQPQLLWAFFLPLSILATLYFLEHRSYFSAFCIGWIVLVAFLTSAYYALFCALLSVILLFAGLMLRFSTVRVRDIFVLILANIPNLILLYPFATPYMAVREAFGQRRLAELVPFSGSLRSYLAAPPHNIVWGGVSTDLTHYEAYLFPGSLILIFLFVALLSLRSFNHWYKNDSASLVRKILSVKFIPAFAAVVWLLTIEINLALSKTAPSPTLNIGIAIGLWILLLTCVVQLISEGTKLYKHKDNIANAAALTYRWQFTERDFVLILIFGAIFFIFASFGLMSAPRKNNIDPGLFMLLFHYFPGIDAVRAASRIGIIADLFIILLAAFGLKHLLNKFAVTKRSAPAWIICIGLSVIQIVELKHSVFPLQPPLAAPPVYQTLAAVENKGVVLALPSGFIGDSAHDFALKQTKYMQWIQTSDQIMVNGYSGKMPKFQEERIPAVSRYFPSPRSIAYLTSIIGLKYIVFHSSESAEFDIKKFELALNEVKDQLKLLAKDEHGNYLFEIRSSREIARAGDTEFYASPSTSAKRYLSFEYSADTAAADVSPIEVKVRLGFEFDADNKQQPVFRTFIVKPNKEWAKLTFTIPQSTSVVQPHKIIFSRPKATEGTSVSVRNVNISRTPSK